MITDTLFSPPVPVILIKAPSDARTLPEAVQKASKFFSSHDDVFCAHFLKDTIILQNETQKPLSKKLAVPGFPNLKRFVQIGSQGLPEGPYFLTSEGNLIQAWRLYPDTQDAFCVTFTQYTGQLGPKFQPLNVSADGGLWRQVAVPSRLYSLCGRVKPKEKPLAGKRISIKDNFKVTGIKTTQNNRAWVECYPPESETAAIIKHFISLGAFIVGKTKMCAFASSEEATDQWVDFHAPFNPRCDGYQSCSGSTSGGGAGLASYEWLDFSVGTDTTGSIRWPAAWNGLYGLRTSWEQDAKTLDGVYHSCIAMDTLGLLSRNIDGLQELLVNAIPSLANSGAGTTVNRVLYCTDFLPSSVDPQIRLLDKFVAHLIKSLGPEAKREDISIADRWAENPPIEDQSRDIRKYLEKSAYYPFYYDGFHEFAEFRKKYKDDFGKPAFVGPYMRWKWDQGEKVTREEREKGLSEIEVYKRWFSDNVLSRTADGQSTAIMILPCGSGYPKYRDLPNAAPSAVPAFSPNYIASMLGLPQIVLPIGQIPFESRISRREEYLPIVASFVGAQGSDLMLVKLGQKVLEGFNGGKAVKTGRFMFDPTQDS